MAIKNNLKAILSFIWKDYVYTSIICLGSPLEKHVNTGVMVKPNKTLISWKVVKIVLI